MSAGDTVRNRTTQVKGKIKELLGRATGRRRLTASGQGDMVGGEVKQRSSTVKDTITK